MNDTKTPTPRSDAVLARFAFDTSGCTNRELAFYAIASQLETELSKAMKWQADASGELIRCGKAISEHAVELSEARECLREFLQTGTTPISSGTKARHTVNSTKPWAWVAQCANGLEIQCREKEMALRANLEALVKRWNTQLPDPDDAKLDQRMGGLFDATADSISELRKVLSGETPPALGEEWSQKP